MTARIGHAVGGFAFAVSVALAAAGYWLLAVVVTLAPAYVAGRWDRRRDRDAELVSLAADLASARDRVAALQDRVAALEDHIDEEHARRAAGRWLDESRFVPDERPDWPAVDRKPTPADATSPARPLSTTL